VKMLPFFGGEVVDPVAAIAMHVTPTQKSETPWTVCRIEAIRSGTTVTVNWWPTSQDNKGAATASPEAQTDIFPFPYDGDFETYYTGESPTTIIDATQRAYTLVGAHTFYVRGRRSGFLGTYAAVAVGAADGTYVGPDA